MMVGILTVQLLLLLCSVAAGKIVFQAQPRNATVKVGETANFNCEYTGTKAIPFWMINGCIYSWDDIKGDYNLVSTKEGFVLQIAEAKLWMNNTTISCEFSSDNKKSDTGVLCVIFDFGGPSDTTTYIGDNAFISCSSPLLSTISIIWSIDGSIYVPTRLPTSYKIDQKGLWVLKVKKEMNGTRYQCIFHSDMLLKGYYTSEVGVLTVLNRDDNIPHKSTVGIFTDQQLPLDSFRFINKNFSFSESSITIYWESPVSCNSSATYYLVRTLAGEQNRTSLGHSNYATIPIRDLEDQSGNTYRIRVDATIQDTQCGTSQETLEISPNVVTNVQEHNITSSQRTLCFDSGNASYSVIFPKSLDKLDFSDCTCPCSMIMQCGCFNETEYSIYNTNIKICLGDLTREMDGIQIYLVYDVQVDIVDDSPLTNRIFKKVHKLVFVDAPDGPEVTFNGHELCLTDTYNGLDDVIDYSITIEDNTELEESINVTKSGSTNRTCVPISDYLMSNCGPFNISVSSRNHEGYSQKTTLKIEGDDGPSVCTCFQHFFDDEINITFLKNASLPRDVLIQMNCSNSVSINVTITSELDSHAASVQCGESHQISGLKSDNLYVVTFTWAPVEKEGVTCIIDSFGKSFGTGNENGIWSDHVHHIFSFVYFGLLVAMAIMQIITIFCVCKICCKQV